MKNLTSSLLPFLAIILMLIFFSACEKDEFDSTSTEPIPPTTTVVTGPVAARLVVNGVQEQSSSSTGSLEIVCISIDYPFDFDVDGVIYTINSTDDIVNIYTNVINSNTMFFDFVYPLNINLMDGTAAIAADEDELAAHVSACIPDTGWGNGFFPAFFFDNAPCASIAYPVTLGDADSTAIVVQDQTGFINTLAANPDLWFAFPLNVHENGVVVIAQDSDMLFDILARCANPSSGGGNINDLSVLLGLSCFKYDYPISIVDFDGNTISIDNNSEFAAAILSGNFFDFDYSFTVTWGPVGIPDTINNQADFEVLVQNCTPRTTHEISLGTLLTNAFVDSCFSLIYPFTAGTLTDTLIISNRAELNSLAASNIISFIAFPIDVQQGTQIITLNNAQEYDNLTFNCTAPIVQSFFAEAFLTTGLDPLGCYDLIYPITVNNIDNTTFVVNNETEVRAYLLVSTLNELIHFPIDVSERSTGVTITFQDLGDYLRFLDDCQ